MKIQFQGRRFYASNNHWHIYPVIDLAADEDQTEEPIYWETAKRAWGKIKGLNLNGNYSIVFNFHPSDLRNWLKQYIADEPEAAVRLLAEMQAEAAIHLAQNPKTNN